MLQASVGQVGAVKPKRLELDQPGELPQAGIRNFCPVELQSFQSLQPGDLLDARIRHVRALNVKLLEFAEHLNVLQAGVGKSRVVEIQ